MPQMTKGGKFIFGKSLLREDGSLRLPPQAVEEYQIASEGRVYLFTGSRITGGFCVTRKGLLLPSKLGHILTDMPALMDYTAGEGAFQPEIYPDKIFSSGDVAAARPFLSPHCRFILRNGGFLSVLLVLRHTAVTDEKLHRTVSHELVHA